MWIARYIQFSVCVITEPLTTSEVLTRTKCVKFHGQLSEAHRCSVSSENWRVKKNLVK